jgi:hypothetical protein
MEGVIRTRTGAPLIVTLAYSLPLVAIGYRLFVDATAAVLYNADERIPRGGRVGMDLRNVVGIR